MGSATVNPAALQYLDQMVSAQNLEKAVELLNYAPLVISLLIFSCTLIIQLFFPAREALRKIVPAYMGLGFITFVWFQGCSGAGPTASNTQLVNEGGDNYIQPTPKTLFYARAPQNGLIEIPLPSGVVSFDRSYAAPISQGGYFVSEPGDDTSLTSALVPSYAPPALNYKIENGILKISDTHEATAYLFVSDQISVSVAAQLPLTVALGALRKEILPLENPKPKDVQQAFDRALAGVNLKGFSMTMKTIDQRQFVQIFEGQEPKGLIQILKDDDRKQLETLDDAHLIFNGSKTPPKSTPPGPSKAQITTFNRSLVAKFKNPVMNSNVTHEYDGAIQNADQATLEAPNFSEPTSIVDALGWTKWEAYNGFSSAEINQLKLHLWALNDAGNIDQLAGGVDANQVGPRLYDNPVDPLIPLFAKIKVLQDSKSVFLNTTRLNDPLYKTGNVVERDTRATGNIADAIISFHKAGTKFQVASKGAIFMGPKLNIDYIPRKHTSNPQGASDLQMPVGYENATINQSNEYWGLFYFPTVDEAITQAQNLNEAVKNLFGADPDSKFLQMGRDYLTGLNQLNFERTGDQRCEVYSDDPNTIYPEASIALMEGAPFLKYHIRAAARECGGNSAAYPAKRAFPWMYGEDFAIVMPTAGGGARVMVLMTSTLDTGYQAVESKPYATWIVLKLFNDGFFNPTKDLSSTLVQKVPRNYFYASDDGDFQLTNFINDIKDMNLEFHFHRDPKPAIYKRAAAPSVAELDKAITNERTGLYQKVNLELPPANTAPDSALEIIPYGTSYAFAIFKRQKLECSDRDLAQKSERYWGSVQQIWDASPFDTYDLKPEEGLGCYSAPPTPSGLGLEVEWIDPGDLYDENGNRANPDGYKNCTTTGINYQSDFIEPSATPPGRRNDVCESPNPQQLIDDTVAGLLVNTKHYEARYRCSECWVEPNTNRTTACEGVFRIPRREIPLLPQYHYFCGRKSASQACLGVASTLIFPRRDLMDDVGDPLDPSSCDLTCAGGMSPACESCRLSFAMNQHDYWDYLNDRLVGQISAFKDYDVRSGANSTGSYKLEVWGAPSTGGSYSCNNTCAWPEPNQIIPLSDDWIQYLSRYDDRVKPPEPRSLYRFLTTKEVWDLRRPQLTASLSENASDEQIQARDRLRTYFDLISIYYANNNTSVTGARSTPGGNNGNGGDSETERDLPLFGHINLNNSNLLVDDQKKYFTGETRRGNYVDFEGNIEEGTDNYSYLKNFSPRLYQWFPGGFSDWSTIHTIDAYQFDTAHAGLFDVFYLNFHLNNKWSMGFGNPFGVQADRLPATDNELWGGSVGVPAIGRYTLGMHAKEIFEYPNGVPSLALGTYKQTEEYAPRLEYWLIDELHGLDSSIQPSSVRSFINPMPAYKQLGKYFYNYFQQEEPPVNGSLRKRAKYQLIYQINGFRISFGDEYSPTAQSAPKFTKIGNRSAAYPNNMLNANLMQHELPMPEPKRLLSDRSRFQRALDMKAKAEKYKDPSYFYFGQAFLDLGGWAWLPFIDFEDQNYETQDVCPGCDAAMLASEINPCERHRRNSAGDTCWWCSDGTSRTYFCDWPPPGGIDPNAACGADMEDPFPWTDVNFWSSGARTHCSVGTSLRYGAGDNVVKMQCDKADAGQCGYPRADDWGLYRGSDPDATTESQLKGIFPWRDESASCAPCPNLWRGDQSSSVGTPIE